MRKGLLVFALTAVVLMSASAMATTITGNYGGQTFTANVTVVGTTASVTLGGPAGYTTDMAGIQVSDPLTSGSLTSGPAGWTGMNSNVGGGSNGSSCSGTGNWLCASGPQVTINGLLLSWTFDGANQNSAYSAWFQIFDPSGKFVANFSCQVGENDSTCGSTSTPEPASLGLLATGLLALGGLVRRRK